MGPDLKTVADPCSKEAKAQRVLAEQDRKIDPNGSRPEREFLVTVMQVLMGLNLISICSACNQELQIVMGCFLPTNNIAWFEEFWVCWLAINLPKSVLEAPIEPNHYKLCWSFDNSKMKYQKCLIIPRNRRRLEMCGFWKMSRQTSRAQHHTYSFKIWNCPLNFIFESLTHFPHWVKYVVHVLLTCLTLKLSTYKSKIWQRAITS